MVTFYVVSEYSSISPTTKGGEKIPGGRLYDLDRVKTITEGETGLKLWTRKCIKDVNNLFDGDVELVADLIQCLHDTDYIDSEWCENGGGALAGCDAYALRRMEWIATAGKKIPVEYFVKFAIAKTGTVLLTVSCHT